MRPETLQTLPLSLALSLSPPLPRSLYTDHPVHHLVHLSLFKKENHEYEIKSVWLTLLSLSCLTPPPQLLHLPSRLPRGQLTISWNTHYRRARSPFVTRENYPAPLMQPQLCVNSSLAPRWSSFSYQTYGFMFSSVLSSSGILSPPPPPTPQARVGLKNQSSTHVFPCRCAV